MPQHSPLPPLLKRIRGCRLCTAQLPHGVRPILQISPNARILIAGQAPGRKVHASGIPFDDASGDRLRDWLGMSREAFYDADTVAILPMGFCYPGSGQNGDLPPRPECAPAWREQLLQQLTQLKLTLAIGQYAQAYHLPTRHRSVTAAVQAWRDYWPDILPLPHPSPRNNRWLQGNPWFASEVIPMLHARIRTLLAEGGRHCDTKVSGKMP